MHSLLGLFFELAGGWACALQLRFYGVFKSTMFALSVSVVLKAAKSNGEKMCTSTRYLSLIDCVYSNYSLYASIKRQSP